MLQQRGRVTTFLDNIALAFEAMGAHQVLRAFLVGAAILGSGGEQSDP
jgi:hypothetical protein